MKKLRTVCAALVLTSVLVLPVFAGEIGTGKTDPPPPPPSAAGEIGTGATDGEIGTGVASDSLARAALSLLQSVLALF